ncbi:TetR/AcrR family transcriptional regulator [Pseudonocardia sp. GCM10023141]|uniref:TetR/AcrR family transcriptional regulator n=1 Tax=Pseudonocardia sp. GCM10023141 TaxID=3252653 RepID=UPI00360F01C0
MVFTERSRPNREAVLAAGLQVFAERGYERTTVRLVAGVAGIDPSMVIRYFGSKEGLFSAVVDVDLRLPDLRPVDRAHRGEVLARHFVDLWEGPRTGPVLVVLLRSATTNDVAAERIRGVFAAQVVELVARLSPSGTSGAGDVAARAGRVAAHVLGVALTRYVLVLPPVAALSSDEVVAMLAPALQCQLDL